MFHCINLKLCFSRHQCVDICAVSTFWLLWKMMLWTFMHKFLCKSIFFFWFINRNRISGSYGDCLFNFLRNWQNVDQNIWVSLHSHWNSWISLHSHWQTLSLLPFSRSSPTLIIFFITTILVILNWSLWFGFPFPWWVILFSIFLPILAKYISSLEKCLWKPNAHFSIVLSFYYWALSVLYTFQIQVFLSDILSLLSFFNFYDVVKNPQFLNVIKFNLAFFSFAAHTLVSCLKIICQIYSHKNVPLCFILRVL